MVSKNSVAKNVNNSLGVDIDVNNSLSRFVKSDNNQENLKKNEKGLFKEPISKSDFMKSIGKHANDIEYYSRFEDARAKCTKEGYNVYSHQKSNDGKRCYIVAKSETIFELSKTKQYYFYEHYNYGGKNNKNDNYHKAFADIDMSINLDTKEEIILVEKTLADSFISVFTQKCNKLFNSNDNYRFHILTSSRRGKISLHLICYDVKFNSMEIQKEFMKQCSELFITDILIKLPQYKNDIETKKSKIVDLIVYGNHNLRMLYNSKMTNKIPLEFLNGPNEITNEIFDQTLIHKTTKDMKTISNSMIEIINHKKKFQDEITKISKHKNIKTNHNVIYSYNKGKIIEMLNKLPIEYARDYDLWTIIGNTLKTENLYKIFDNFSKRCPEKYNAIENKEKYWNTWIPKMNIDFLNAVLYENDLKPIIRKTERVNFMQKIPNTQVDQQYIEIENLYRPDLYKGLVLHCSTGSGKSRKTSELLSKILKEDEKCKLLMIESRVSMGTSHWNDFDEYAKIKIKNHDKITDNIELNESRYLSICIDSLQRLMLESWKDCILYLDEFASTLPHILNSHTLESNNKRTICFMMLMHLIKECKFVFICDADMNDSCIMFLEKLGIKYYLYQNNYKTYENTKAYEFTQEQNLIDKLKIESVKSDKPIIASFDCLTKLEMVYAEICIFLDTNGMSDIKNSIKKYTKDEYNSEEIKEIGKTWSSSRLIMYSPKITVGISFSHNKIKYNSYVFSYGSSVNSSIVYQQLSRNRNINNLYYYVANKVCKRKFYSVDQVREYYTDILKCYDNFKINYNKDTIEKDTLMDKFKIDHDDFKKSIKLLENYVLLDIERNYKFSNDIFETSFYYDEYYEDILRSDHKFQFELILIRKGFEIVHEDYEYYQQLEKNVENPMIQKIKNNDEQDVDENDDEIDYDETEGETEEETEEDENNKNYHTTKLQNGEIKKLKIEKIDKRELKKNVENLEQKTYEKILDGDIELMNDREKKISNRIDAVAGHLKINTNDVNFMKQIKDLIMSDDCMIKYKNFLNLVSDEGIIFNKIKRNNNYMIKKLKSDYNFILLIKKLEKILNVETLNINSSNESVKKRFFENVEIDKDFLKLYKFESKTKNKEIDTNKRFDFWYYELIKCYKKILPKGMIINGTRFYLMRNINASTKENKKYVHYKTDLDVVKKYLQVYSETNTNYTNIDKKLLNKLDIKIEYLG